MSNPQHLDYAQADRRPPLHLVALVIMTIQVTAYIAVPILVLMYAVPRFEATFSDYRTPLPASTKLVLGLSHLATRGYGWPALGVLAGAVVLGGLLVDSASPSGLGLKIYRGIFIRLLLLAMVALSALIVVACYMPMFNLINTVSGAGRR